VRGIIDQVRIEIGTGLSSQTGSATLFYSKRNIIFNTIFCIRIYYFSKAKNQFLLTPKMLIMKKNLDFYKQITVTLVVTLISIFACESPSATTELSPQNIKIEGVDPNGELDLRDAGNHSAKIFKVGAGKTINWLDNTLDVSNIDSIYKKTTTQSDNLFKSGPSRIGHSRNWTATIDPNAQSGQFEDYSIDWTDANGQKHTFDPRIQINP
jgi:hypothetical protein